MITGGGGGWKTGQGHSLTGLGEGLHAGAIRDRDLSDTTVRILKSAIVFCSPSWAARPATVVPLMPIDATGVSTTTESSPDLAIFPRQRKKTPWTNDVLKFQFLLLDHTQTRPAPFCPSEREIVVLSLKIVQLFHQPMFELHRPERWDHLPLILYSYRLVW